MGHRHGRLGAAKLQLPGAALVYFFFFFRGGGGGGGRGGGLTKIRGTPN